MAVLRIVNHLTFAKFIHKFSVVGLNFKDIFYIKRSAQILLSYKFVRN
jgi:hypothetical protein